MISQQTKYWLLGHTNTIILSVLLLIGLLCIYIIVNYAPQKQP